MVPVSVLRAPASRDRSRPAGGLYLVQTLSDRWGVEPDDPTCVWFEVDLRNPPAMHDPRRLAPKH